MFRIALRNTEMKTKTKVDCHIPSKRLEIEVDFTPDEISRVLCEIEMKKTETVAPIVEARIKKKYFQQGISRLAGILLRQRFSQRNTENPLRISRLFLINTILSQSLCHRQKLRYYSNEPYGTDLRNGDVSQMAKMY